MFNIFKAIFGSSECECNTEELEEKINNKSDNPHDNSQHEKDYSLENHSHNSYSNKEHSHEEYSNKEHTHEWGNLETDYIIDKDGNDEVGTINFKTSEEE